MIGSRKYVMLPINFEEVEGIASDKIFLVGSFEWKAVSFSFLICIIKYINDNNSPKLKAIKDNVVAYTKPLFIDKDKTITTNPILENCSNKFASEVLYIFFIPL